jgi:hypothetical protein
MTSAAGGPFGPPDSSASSPSTDTAGGAPFAPAGAPSPVDAPPPSAPHYAPPLPPPAPPAPPAARPPSGQLAGQVTQVDLSDGRPPLDLGRWLSVVALLAGTAPFFLSKNTTLIAGGVALAVIIAVVGGWLALRAGRQRRLLRLTVETATRGDLRVLMVDPTGQPALGDEIEASGRGMSAGEFYASRLRVTSAGAASSAASSALARGGAYTGRSAVSLLTPLLTLLFCVFFWVFLYLFITYVTPQFLAH